MARSSLVGWILALALTTPLGAQPTTIEVDYFGLPSCHDCREFLDTTWEQLRVQAAAQGIELVLREHDILDPRAFAQMKQMLEARDTPFTGVPVLVADRVVLMGDDLSGPRLAARWSLGGTPEAAPAPSAPTPAPAPVTWAVVGVAGLVDGVNPCVITLLVFLLSVARVGRRALWWGLAYAAGVFTAYTAVGLGLLQAASLTRAAPWASGAVEGIAVVSLVAFAVLSLWDARMAALGRSRSVVLRLPTGLDRVVRRLARTQRHGTLGVATAFVLGALISLLEFVCTGQVYLPTLVYLNQSGSDGALGLLLWYNLAFVVPLVVVFAVVQGGLGHQRLVLWARSNVAASKVLLAGVYALLAGAILAT